MVVVGLFIGLVVLVVVLLEIRERRRKKGTKRVETPVPPAPSATPKPRADGECCGQHAVCERDSLLTQKTEIVYYDDEELDALAGLDPANYTEDQLKQLQEVFYTMQESDVAGWLRSLQSRNIALPLELREEALLIVAERRQRKETPQA